MAAAVAVAGAVGGGGTEGRSEKVDAASFAAVHGAPAIVAELMCARFGSCCVSSIAPSTEEQRRAPILSLRTAATTRDA
jgi:hypothetical protein